MPRSSAYFMHDQVRRRVARIMDDRTRRTTAALPVWPLITLIAALTVINLLTTIPGP